jgi:hypothetical protein
MSNYNNYVFWSEDKQDAEPEIHNGMFDAFYRDLKAIGLEGMKALRKTKKVKIESLNRSIRHYEGLQEYERCQFLKSVLDGIDK